MQGRCHGTIRHTACGHLSPNCRKDLGRTPSDSRKLLPHGSSMACRLLFPCCGPGVSVRASAQLPRWQFLGYIQQSWRRSDRFSMARCRSGTIRTPLCPWLFDRLWRLFCWTGLLPRRRRLLSRFVYSMDDAFRWSLTAIPYKVMSAVLQGQISSYKHYPCTDV
jgi:hypothetical protein